jgi:hypothetical protein
MTCQGCGKPITQSKYAGQPRKWCSNTCRKHSCYSGVCTICGAATYSGNAIPPDLCEEHHHAAQHAERYWTPERVIAAIRRFAAENGSGPSAGPWLHGEKPDYAPDVTTVQREFGSWSAAIEAAGVTPAKRGRPRKAAA